MLKKILYIGLLSCFSIIAVHAQISILYSTENQISSSLVNDIYQDKQGFIWISTEYGLNRFDGNEFITYRHKDNDSTSLKNNYVHLTFEDSKGNLWVGTMGGLATYDRNTDSFTSIPLYKGKQLVYSDITQIIENKEGTLWASSSGEGLFRILPEQARGECITAVNRLGFRHLSTLLDDGNGNLWIGAENDGLICYNTANESIKTFKAPVISEDNISSLAKDEYGYIYIGTLTGGLNVYNPFTKQIRQIPYQGRYDLQIKTLTYIDHQLYIGTDGEGLKLYDANMSEMIDKQLENSRFEIENKKIHSVLFDRNGNLWLGLFQQGVAFIPMQHNPFQYYGLKSLHGSPFGTQCVMSIYQDNDRNIYVGTDNDGLYILDEKFHRLHHLQPSKDTHSVANTILSIFQDSDNEIWLGTYTKGVAKLNVKSNSCEFIPELMNERVFAITEDFDRNLYFSSYGRGLFVYNKDTKQLTQYKSPEENTSSQNQQEHPSNWINALYHDSKGLIWVGHFKGVTCFNPKTEKFTHLTASNNILRGCIGYAITEDHAGNIWAGTSNGLYKIDRKTKEIKCYTQQEGLSNNIVCGICEDKRGNIWASTFNGISRLDQKTQTFTTYHSEDGLQGNEFTRGTFFQSTNGTVYFGGIYGITCFRPEHIVDKRTVPPVVITDFKVSGQSVNTNTLSGGDPIVETAVTDATRFRLSHNDNTFSISFSTLQFAQAGQTVYKYRICELDKDWQTTKSGVNSVTYNNLAPGKYTFEVYAIDHGYQSDIKTIAIHIAPPWFRSGWAYLLYCILIGAIILTIIGYIQERIRQRKEMMERRHAEELSESKLQFFINISHEIRTPLTLIISPLEKLIDTCEKPELNKTYMMIYRNSQRILRLINQLMDIRKIDKGQMNLKFRETDLVEFIDDIVNTFSYTAKNKHINFTFRHLDEHLKAWIDLNNFDKVLMNLLSNAFKYTPDGGNIDINLRAGRDYDASTPLRQYIEITVSDTGIGLDDKQLEHIFDRFYQINNDITRNQAGTGVGLHLTRSLVELHHGTITASNRTDCQGSRFTVRIPQGCNHLRIEELDTSDSISQNARIVIPAKRKRRADSDEDESLVASPDMGKKQKTKSNPHVLIVDDEKDIREYLRNELSKEYKVDVCGNGAEAYDFLLHNPVHLLISDVMMPEMDGITLCRKVRANTNINHIPIILLTAKGRNEDLAEGMETGADSYIVKPFSIEVLRSTINNLIETRRLLKNKFSGAQEQSDKVQEVKVNSSDEILMERIMAVINENLADPALSVEMVANSIGISRVHLHRKLKELTNLSTRDFIRNIRMQQAAKLLKEKRLSISDVAYAVGYSNLSHFSNTFKELFGETPKEYTQKLHGNENNDVSPTEETPEASKEQPQKQPAKQKPARSKAKKKNEGTQSADT